MPGHDITIIPIEEVHWSDVWAILKPVFRGGETYAFPLDITEQQAHGAWVELPAATFVALDEQDRVLGTYYIKPNYPGPGGHVCNCGYIVAANAQGRGVASLMCKHSQVQAQQMGFFAMQYNLVAISNKGAIRLWQKHGFEIVATLPKAFDHPSLGLVDAHVMYKIL